MPPRTERRATSLLFVDDEHDIAFSLAAAMRTRGYETDATTSPREALEMVQRQDFDVSVVDLVMPEMDGIALVRELLRRDPRMRCLILTAYGAVDTCDLAYRAGVVRYLQKPIKSLELDQVVREILNSGEHLSSLPEIARIVNPAIPGPGAPAPTTEEAADAETVVLALDLESTTLATFKHEAIGRYLAGLYERCDACPKQMAHMAGVCLSTMYRLLNEHGISYSRNPNLGRPRSEDD